MHDAQAAGREAGHDDAATRLFLARRVHTFAARPARAEAVLTRAGRVLAVGTGRALRRQAPRGTLIVDLPGATLTPGLTDAHTHFFYWALQRALVIDLAPARSLAEVQRLIRRGAARRRCGGWIVGCGFEHNRWNTGLPTAADLDAALAGLPEDLAAAPALMRSRDFHTAWLNSAALRAAGLTPQTPDPPGGRYGRDAAGRLTGIVQEAAINLLPDPFRALAQRDDAAARRMVDQALAAGYQAARHSGIVAVHSMDDAPSLAHLQRHHADGRLGVRVVHAIPLAELPAARRLGLRCGLGDDWLRLGGVKIFADGALGSQTAYMFDPYPGRGDSCGVPVIVGEELRAAVLDAVQAGWPVWVHAIGDRAAHEVLTAIQHARRSAPRSAALPPHRIEHAQCVRPADIRRMAALGVAASVQPCHILGDIENADRHWPRARRHAYPLRRLLSAGVTLAAGSDIPIESIDPRRSLFAAVRRTDEAGRPAGGWFASEVLTIEETLLAFTRGAAASLGRPRPDGTLAPGAPADLTIWGADPLTCAPGDLLAIPILGSVVAGGEAELV